MDVSLLQHAKDKSPQAVTLDKVVELIRGNQWPPGYQPLMVVSAVVEGGLQKKNVRWLTGLAVNKLRGKKEEVRGKGELVRDDPHTLLCWTDQSGGMYVVYAYELNSMRAEENNKLKTVSTMRFSDVRQPYDTFAEHRKIIASFCGTGNNVQFLNDPSGNRRWLPYDSMIKKRKAKAVAEQSDMPDPPDPPDVF